MAAFFGAFGALQTLTGKKLPVMSPNRRSWGFLAIAAMVFLAMAPFQANHLRFNTLEKISQSIAEPGKKTVVLGPYFRSYIWEGLNPASVQGLPAEGHSLRIPWTYRTLKQADRILRCRGFPVPGVQYGVRLAMMQEHWKSSSVCGFDLLIPAPLPEPRHRTGQLGKP